MKDQLIKRFGEDRVVSMPVAEGEMPILVINLDVASPVTLICTNGLSNYKMPVPEAEIGNEYNELFFCLPSYWEWEDINNPQMNWVFNWIQRLSKYVVDKKTWFGHGHTMPCGQDMQSLSSTMLQNHFILINPILLEDEMAPVIVDGHRVNFLAIVPIFGDEMDYKQGKGTVKFLRKLIGKGVSEKLDDYRSTSLKSKWRLRR